MPTVREAADWPWLVLLSRAAAACAIPATGAAFWMYATMIGLERDVERHEDGIVELRQRMVARETNAFTNADAAAMEARLSAADDQLLEELRLIRSELQQDRRSRNP